MTLALATVGYLQDEVQVNLPPPAPEFGDAVVAAAPLPPSGEADVQLASPPSGG